MHTYPTKTLATASERSESNGSQSEELAGVSRGCTSTGAQSENGTRAEYEGGARKARE